MVEVRREGSTDCERSGFFTVCQAPRYLFFSVVNVYLMAQAGDDVTLVYDLHAFRGELHATTIADFRNVDPVIRQGVDRVRGR